MEEQRQGGDTEGRTESRETEGRIETHTENAHAYTQALARTQVVDPSAFDLENIIAFI